ncbi:MAG: hypothetical protein ACLFR1_02315 [Spirochaetia bacterium]
MINRIFIMVVILAALCSFSVYADLVDGLYFQIGQTWVGNSQDVSSPNPIIIQFNTGVIMDLPWLLYLSPDVFVGGYHYTWQEEQAMAIPVAREFATGSYVLYVNIDPGFGLRLPVTDSVAFGVSLGPAFLLRFPVLSYGGGKENAPNILGYLLGGGRFFYPQTSAQLDWAFSDSIRFLLKLRVFYPIHHYWTGDSLPFYDQLIIQNNIGFVFEL